jgi:hypothetical protein
MLALAPLIALLCLLLSYLKGLNLLLLVCAATFLHCIRRHTFNSAGKSTGRSIVKATTKPQKTIGMLATTQSQAPPKAVSYNDDAAMRAFWQLPESDGRGRFAMPKSLASAKP